MPAGRVGVIFVELDMDKTRFIGAQKAVYDDAVSTSLKIEQNYKSLGIKSAAYFDVLQQRASNAYTMIANKSLESTASQVRAHAAMIAQINATKVGMTQNSFFDALGVKSQAMIEAQKAAIISNHNELLKSNQATAIDRVNLEAKTNKDILALDNELNAATIASNKAQWDSLGIRSTSAIKSEMDMVRNSALEKKALYARGSQDYINISKAETDKLKSLHKEMVGSHDMSMAAMTRSVLRFYAAWYVASTAVTAVIAPIREGFRYLAAMETSGLGIAASLATAGRFIEQTTQKALEGQAALNEAQKMSKSIVKELEFENIRTIATLDQLVNAYQTALPVAMAKGFDVEQVKSFTVAMVQAAGAIGLPFDQMAEEIRSLLTGSINPKNSRIATVLGLRNEDINQYKGNADELFNFLMSKLSAYKEAGIEAQTTWAGLWSNAKDIADQFLGKITEPLFNEIKTGMQDLINNMVTLDEKTKTIKWNPAFIGEIEHIQQGIRDTTEDVKSLWNFYQSLPDGITSAAGYGILGRMIFGNWKAAALIGTVQFISNQLNNLATLITGFKPKGIGESFSDLSKYIQGIEDVFSGKRDLNTGRVFSQLELDIKAAREEYEKLLSADSIDSNWWKNIDIAQKKIETLTSKLSNTMEGFDSRPKTTLSDLIGVSLLETEPGAVEYVANVVSGVDELGKANDKAADAAKAHADKIADVIANLQWETQMLSLSEDEQYRMNALKSAGIGINDKMAASVLAVADAYLEAKKNAEAWKPFLDFMSDEKTNDMSIQVHEGAMEAQEKNLQSMVDYWPEIADASSDSAKRTDEAWTEAAKNIQNAWAGLFSKIFRGEITGADDVLKELMYTMSDSAAQNLAAQLRDIDWNKALGGMDNDLGEFFTTILDDFGMTAGQAVNGLAAVIATAYSAVGMAKKDAALSGSMTGASVGGQAGGGYGAAIGAVLGGAGGWLLGTNGPSYGERLSDAIEKLIETLQANNILIADQILKTDELTLAQEKMQRSVFSTKMEGVNATLAGAFKIPEGMEKRSQSGWEKFGDVYKSFAVDLVSGMQDSYQRTLELTLHGKTDYGVKDKGYTSTDYSKAETSAIISDLIGKIRLPDFITLMSQTSNDAGALIDKLVEVGYITAEIPERVLEYYSGGSSKAKRIEKVADAIFEVMLNGIMELSAGIDEMNLASEAFAKTWADKSLTSKAKDMQDWQDTMNVFSGEGMKGYLAQIEATRDALLSISDEELTKLDTAALEDHFKKISALDKVLTDSAGKIAEAEQTRIVIEQYYADARLDILAGMTEEMDIASGKYSKMEQSYMSIMDSAEKYRLELVDQGMEYQEAGAASKEYAIILKGVALATQLAADTANYESRILQEKISRATTLNKTEELQALNQELINNNRKAEVQALMDTYKAGTPAYQAMIKLAKETWGVEDAANNATGAMAKVAEAMEGMWTKDSEAVAKGWWLQINEALGRAFTPTLFLDSLGLGKDSGLEGLLSANSMEEVDADLREMIALWRTGKINEDQANSILSKINENAATIGQKIDDLANSLSQQREIGKASQEWYDSFFADSGLSELDKSLKDSGDTLEDFRQQIMDAGGSVRAGWEAGGTIETAVKDAIRSNFLADFRTEFADAVRQSSYMQSKASISKQAGGWEQTYLGATVDPEIIAARIAAINAGLEANLTILNQQAIARADESGVLAGINESINILTDNAQNSITTLQGLARSEEELNAIRQYAADQTRQLNIDLLNNVRGTAFDITGDTDILTQQLIDLAEDWQKADAQDYGEQYDILTKQNDILTQLRDIQKQQLEETIGNYNALQDVILDLQGGSLAPVQSKEFFDKRYAQLYEAAQSGKSSDINNLTGFISQYADFMGAYGDSNYKEFTASIISDFEALQGSITGGATLDDLNAQLATLNSASSPIVSELIRIGDILAGLTGSGSLSQAMAFDEQAYLKRYADVAAAVIAGQFASGLEHYQEFGASEGRLPGFARGGSFIAGENGAEIVNIGAGSSARIFNNGETAKIIADAVSKAIGGAVGGGNVTVHVSIDGKAIAPSMVKVIQTNPEAQYQIKRVANGR